MANPKFFFATKADLEPGLKKVESWLSIKYVQSGFHKSPDVTTYRSALDIPDFGVSVSGWFYSGPYLILPADTEIYAKPIPQSAGGILYQVEPQHNPEGFWLRSGGWYTKKKRRALVGGEVAGYAQDADVRRMFSRYIRTLTKGFTVVPDQYNCKWWVGPEAMNSLQAGTRLVCYDARAEDDWQIYLSLNGYDYLKERRERHEAERAGNEFPR